MARFVKLSSVLLNIDYVEEICKNDDGSFTIFYNSNRAHIIYDKKDIQYLLDTINSNDVLIYPMVTE